jgi:hypothetical protein
MKEMETEVNDMDRLKKLKIDRKAEISKFICIPDQSTADFERQLKKLATKGGFTHFIFIV